MTSVVVLFQRIEEAKGIKNLLVRNGFQVAAVCTQGSQALAATSEISGGIVICGYKYQDMFYRELHENLPSNFDMLLLASKSILAQEELDGIVSLEMPLRVQDFLDIASMMVENAERRRRKARSMPKQRSQEELSLISKAKALLMEKNHMTEEEAHKYLQKCSMDSGTNLVETVHMVLTLLGKE